MKTYQCLIVDDEQLAQELLAGYVAKIPYLNLITTCSDALTAMQVLQNQEVDILLLDIHMPNLSGLELLPLLKKQPATILTTAYSEYALQAYDLDVIDYVVKPIEFDRFLKAITKAIDSLTNKMPLQLPEIREEKSDYCFIKVDYKIVKLMFEDILFIEAQQKYIRIYTTKEKLITLLSLSKMLELLPQQEFIRIHRSYAISLAKIDSIEGNMVHIGQHNLPISKGQKESFLNLVRSKGVNL